MVGIRVEEVFMAKGFWGSGERGAKGFGQVQNNLSFLYHSYLLLSFK